MPTSNAQDAAGSEIPQGTRGPEDDFFCHKYQVWYRVEDCVYRGRNRTFPGCVDCFQGHLNIRSVEKGIAPPALGGGGPAGGGASEGNDRPGRLLRFAVPSPGPRQGTDA